MAPRAPVSAELVISQLKGNEERLKKQPYKFGAPHFTHAVVAEDGVFRVRRLVPDLVAQRKAFEEAMAQKRSFMPEHAEQLTLATGAVVLEAPTLEELIAKLRESKWPLT